MTDTTELHGLDPFDLLDGEAERLDRFFGSLEEDGWERQSRCDKWSVRDVLSHLAGVELYFRACIDDDLDSLFKVAGAAGVTDIESFNDWTVESRADRPPKLVHEEWRAANAEFRRRMRARGPGATMTTMAGPYPVELQAWHIANELATHADDVGVPVEPSEAGSRTGWRARLARFALREKDRPVTVTVLDGGNNRVEARSGAEAILSDGDLVEASVGRLAPDHPLHESLRAALRTVP